MKPWMHAQRTAAEMGGSFSDHLAAHAFLDRTKDAYAQITHRFLLHTVDLGVLALQAALPKGPDAATLVALHLRDDLGRAASLADWLDRMRPELLPRVRGGPLSGMTGDERAAAIAARLDGMVPELVGRVCDFLSLPERLAPGAPAEARRLALRNSFGIGLAEACLGAVHETEDGRLVGVREIAEMEVLGETGTIMPYAHVAKAVGIEPWMARDAR